MKLYLPTLIWAGLVLLIAIQAWWASFSMHMRAHWTFLALLVIVLQAISVYMSAALVLPDVTGDAIVDLRDHYFAHRSWFFGALLATVVFSAAKDLALEGHLADRMNLAYHMIFGVLSITGAITRREWFHKLMTLAFVLLFFLYITLLFARLYPAMSVRLHNYAEVRAYLDKEHADWLRALTPMEALLIEGLEPPQNRRRGDDFRAIEYIQREDPELERRRLASLLGEIQSRLNLR